MVDKRSSLRTDVSRKFFLYGTLPLLAVGVIMVWLDFTYTRDDLLAQQQQRVVTVSRLLENALEHYLNDANRAIEANALRMQGLADWRPVLRSYILQQPSVRELALYDPEGREQLRINRDLLVVESSEPSVELARLAAEIAKTGVPKAVKIHTDAASGEPVFTVATPFFDLARARLEFFLISEHRLRPLSLLLSELPGVPGTTLYLLDANQRLLAHQNPSFALRESIHWDASIGSAGVGDVRRGLTGELAMVSTQPIVLGDRTLSVVAEHSIWSTVAVHAQSLLGILVLLAFSAMTLFILTRTVSHRVIAPVEQLSHAAQRVADGHLDTRTELHGSDEIGRLSQAFDTMIETLARTEGELRAHQGRLEEMVEERSAELQRVQEELMTQSRLAMLGQLTGSVAHEIRNPLAAIAASLRVVELKLDGREVDLGDSLNRTKRNLDRCSKIVTELLDFARARGVDKQDTDVNAWVEAVLDEHPLPAGVTLHLDLDAADADISLDPNLLRRALMNLIDNAWQAAAGAHDTPTVSVTTRTHPDAIAIEVADNGPGISEDVLPKIFDPLFSDKPFGVGLGLPIVRQIMEQHGGSLDILRSPEGGVRAVIWLPKTRTGIGQA